MEVSRQLHISAALPPGKSLRYPLDRRLSGPQSRSGRRGEEKILPPIGTRTPTPFGIGRRAIFAKYSVRVRISFIWLRIMSSGGALRVSSTSLKARKLLISCQLKKSLRYFVSHSKLNVTSFYYKYRFELL
jgi:hypothetical protein